MTVSRKAPPIVPGKTWNATRVKHASYALNRFCERSGSSNQAMLADLITDLCHWCDRNEVSFRAELRKGVHAYRKELAEC